MPKTFDNPLKAYFMKKKYTFQAQSTQIVISIFLNEKPVFSGILKIIGAKN